LVEKRLPGEAKIALHATLRNKALQM
jgi:hypothetical protein